MSRANVENIFTDVMYEYLYQARVFVPVSPLYPTLVLASQTGAYLSEAPFSCSTLTRAPGLTHKL